MKRNFENLIGKRFSRWTIVSIVRKYVTYPSFKGRMFNRIYARCRCICGVEKDVDFGNLLSGRSSSCGCYKLECLKSESRKMGTHNMSYTRLYRIWVDMKARCSIKSMPNYYLYGGKGISVCDEWNDSFENFHQWAIRNGYKDTLSIDRIDNSKNYFPENCRWVTAKEQARNRSTNRIVTITNASGEDEKIALPYAAERYGKSLELVRNRLAIGWDIMKALETPVRKYHKQKRKQGIQGELF